MFLLSSSSKGEQQSSIDTTEAAAAFLLPRKHHQWQQHKQQQQHQKNCQTLPANIKLCPNHNRTTLALDFSMVATFVPILITLLNSPKYLDYVTLVTLKWCHRFRSCDGSCGWCQNGHFLDYLDIIWAIDRKNILLIGLESWKWYLIEAEELCYQLNIHLIKFMNFQFYIKFLPFGRFRHMKKNMRPKRNFFPGRMKVKILMLRITSLIDSINWNV